ncbi:chemotaxis protein CheD [Chloroflexota bacterium]
MGQGNSYTGAGYDARKQENDRTVINGQKEDEVIPIVDVYTGEVGAGRKDMVLRSNAIGSCVVIVAYDPTEKVGGLAHAMLPGAAPRGETSGRTKYASDAMEEMIDTMTRLGAKRGSIEVCLVGGGNVLKRKDDTICQANISSVIELLKARGINIRAQAVGGTERRGVSLDVNRGTVHYVEEDEEKKLLWKAEWEDSR